MRQLAPIGTCPSQGTGGAASRVNEDEKTTPWCCYFGFGWACPRAAMTRGPTALTARANGETDAQLGSVTCPRAWRLHGRVVQHAGSGGVMTVCRVAFWRARTSRLDLTCARATAHSGSSAAVLHGSAAQCDWAGRARARGQHRGQRGS